MIGRRRFVEERPEDLRLVLSLRLTPLHQPFRRRDERRLVGLTKAQIRLDPGHASAQRVRVRQLAERHPKSRVLTLDGDFRIYRKHRRQMIPTVMPPRV